MIHARGVYHAHAACPPHGARERRIGRRAANCHVCYHLRTEAPLTTQLVTKEPAMKGIVFAEFAAFLKQIKHRRTDLVQIKQAGGRDMKQNTALPHLHGMRVMRYEA